MKISIEGKPEEITVFLLSLQKTDDVIAEVIQQIRQELKVEDFEYSFSDTQ